MKQLQLRQSQSTQSMTLDRSSFKFVQRLVLLFCLICTIINVAECAAKWHQVSVTGNYRPRAETSFSTCGESRLCLIGGRGPNLVDVLDTATMTWTQGETNSLEMHHMQTVEGPDGCAWISGAWTGPFPNEKTVDQVWKYCADVDEWSIVTSIPRPRGSGGAVLYNNKLYLISGNVGGHNTNAKLVNWFDSYDTITKTWSILPDVPTPRDHYHSVVHNNKLYVIGGRNSTFENVFEDVEPSVDVFDFATQSWQQAPDFPRPRGGTITVSYNNLIVVLGGEGDGRAWKEVDYFSDSSNTYSKGPDVPLQRHGTGAVSCTLPSIWIAGGATVQGCCDNAEATYVLYDDDMFKDRPPVCTALSPSSSPSLLVTDVSPPPSASLPTATRTPSVSAIPTIPSDIQSTPSLPTDTNESNPPIPTDTLSESATPLPSSSSSATTTTTTTTDESESESESEPDVTVEDDQEIIASACFPNDAIVTLSSGVIKRMEHVRIGDDIQVSHSNEKQYSKVYFLSHSDTHSTVPMIQLYVDGMHDKPQLAASPGHLIHVNHVGVIPMSSVGINDQIIVDGVFKNVTTIMKSMKQGLIHPHTFHGDIIVNGVKVSTYTNHIHPTLAYVLLTPFRSLFHILGSHHSVQMTNDVVIKLIDIFYW